LLSQDFVYANPSGNVIFLDYHDTNRFFFDVQKDLNKFKMGMAFLFTTRGIPQLYYGTELLMDRSAASHADVRLDFPGAGQMIK
jgi:glycosidase